MGFLSRAPQLTRPFNYIIAYSIQNYDVSFSPMIPTMINATEIRRRTAVDSPKSTIPATTPPTAPIPVQMAYAVPIGIVRIEIERNHILNIIDMIHPTTGSGLRNPSEYFNATAHKTSKHPANPKKIQFILSPPSLSCKNLYFILSPLQP
jgi:hypothetical protein